MRRASSGRTLTEKIVQRYACEKRGALRPHESPDVKNQRIKFRCCKYTSDFKAQHVSLLSNPLLVPSVEYFRYTGKNRYQYCCLESTPYTSSDMLLVCRILDIYLQRCATSIKLLVNTSNIQVLFTSYSAQPSV